MDTISKVAIRSIVSQLQKTEVKDIYALIGFDACIDNIVRIVKVKHTVGDDIFYNNIRSFGDFLSSRENKSCGVELRTQISKMGGNMVITANALGNLGVKVDCIGTFGLPDVLSVFRSMSPNCKLFTVGDSITTTALEFDDAKVMMFDPGPYNELDWDKIKTLLGIDQIRQFFSEKQLIALLNWSEIENSSEIWKGIIEEILPFLVQSEVKPLFFTDFSDCSRRSHEELQMAIELLSRFRKFFKVILSVNQNEADMIAGALGMSENYFDEDFIRKLFFACMPDELVIHRTRDALSYDGVTIEKCDTFYCPKPAILTGGGDNFNAGYCFARFYDFDLLESLLIANAVSGYYVKNGISPDLHSLIQFLEQQS